MSSYKFFAATALMAALPSALAGQAVINNNCNFPVYITHSKLGTDAAQKEYSPGQSYKETISGDAVCLKVMTQKGFCMTDNCVQLEYTSEPEHLWYDLSQINAGALGELVKHGLSVNVNDPTALPINCPPGKGNFFNCTNTYYQPYDDKASLSAAPQSDITMDLCSSNASGDNSKPLASLGGEASSLLGHASSALAPSAASAPSSAASSVVAQVSSAAPSVASAAAPAVSHAPIVPEVAHNAGSHGPEVIVTVTTTMMAREEQTAAPEKRHIHAHAHHHRH